VRLSTMPVQHGESVVMRLLHRKTKLLALDGLGMPTEMLARLRRLLQRTTGMILVTGPTGSGKTTTLYAALAELNSTETKSSPSRPGRVQAAGHQPGAGERQDRPQLFVVLRSALRQDPDIILVAKCATKRRRRSVCVPRSPATWCCRHCTPRMRRPTRSASSTWGAVLHGGHIDPCGAGAAARAPQL